MSVAPLFIMLVFLLALVLPMAAGLVMIVNSRRGGLGYPACGGCKYNLCATVGRAERCPECGALFIEVGILPARGPRKSLLRWAGIALIVAPLTCTGLAVWPLAYYPAKAAAERRAAVAAQQQATQQQSQEAEAESVIVDSAAEENSTDGSK